MVYWAKTSFLVVIVYSLIIILRRKDGVMRQREPDVSQVAGLQCLFFS